MDATEKPIEKPAEKPSITLGGKPVIIGRPRLSLVIPVAAVAANNETIAEAAALGICWEAGTEPRQPAVYRQFKSNPQVYGEAVLDRLVERGFKADDILRAGRACLSWLWDSVSITATEPEVAAAVGNSEGSDSTP